MEKTSQALCIDDECSFGRLRNGNVYDVSIIDDTPVVIVNGSAHNIDRFEIIN